MQQLPESVIKAKISERIKRQTIYSLKKYVSKTKKGSEKEEVVNVG